MAPISSQTIMKSHKNYIKTERSEDATIQCASKEEKHQRNKSRLMRSLLTVRQKANNVAKWIDRDDDDDDK